MASSLPDDILIEICSRLPVKSVVRFRSVSKEWNSCLSTSQCIKSHLVRHKNHPQSLMLIRRTPDQGCEIRTVSPPITDDVSSCYALHATRQHHVTVLGSCHGLVLIHCIGYGMRLINPATHEQGVNYIPSPPTIESKKYDITYEFAACFGFGYDCSTDDYKIVQFVVGYYSAGDYELRSDRSFALFQVYSVKLGVWTSVTSHVHVGSVFGQGVYMNGAIHWLAANCNYPGYDYAASGIFAFSLADEVIHEIPAPPDVLVDVYQQHSLSVLGGCLCVISCNVNFSFDRINKVWVMKEYGTLASWTSFRLNTRNEKWVVDIPLCFTEDNEIVFINKVDSVVNMYSFEKKTRKKMTVDGDLAVFYEGGTFSESLVSPNQATLVDDQMNAERKKGGRRKGLKSNGGNR